VKGDLGARITFLFASEVVNRLIKWLCDDFPEHE